MKDYKLLMKKFFKEGGWFSFIINSLLIYLSKSAITKCFDGWSLLLSSCISLFIFFIINITLIHTKERLNDDSIRIKFDTETALSIIDKYPILYDYYRSLLKDMVENAARINNEKKLSIDPYQIYSHIVFATQHFKEKIISIDCDINAWYYICEEKDFNSLTKLYKELLNNRIKESCCNQLSLEKKEYLEEYQDRRRIDLTFNISNILMKKDKNGELQGVGSVKRVFILEKKDIDSKTFLILTALERINAETRKKIRNYYILIDDVDEDTKMIIKAVQDIIVFDNMIAYQEYILAAYNGSEINISTDEVEEFMEKIDKILNEASEIRVKDIINRFKDDKDVRL